MRRNFFGAFGGALLLSVVVPQAANAQTNAAPFTTGVRYDLAGREVGLIKPDPDGTGPLSYAATRTTYNAQGGVARIEVGELAVWQSEAVAPAAWSGFSVFRYTEFTYDQWGRKIGEVNVAQGNVQTLVQYSYDAAGRLTCSAVRMNPSIFSSPPADACALGAAGANGDDRVTRNVYEQHNYIAKIQKAYGTSVQQDYATYTYTASGKPTSVIDANGNKAVMSYDQFGRLAQWNFPDKVNVGSVSATDYEAYGYDANGNRTSLRKRDGRTIGYTYDALNRVTSKTFGGGACVSGYVCSAPPSGSVRDVYNDYDLRSLQTGAHFDSLTGADAVINAFDGFGRLTSSTVSMGGVSRTVGQLYDADGNRIRVTHPDGNYFTYDYDGLDRPIAIRENGATQVASFGYDAQGRKSSEARGGVLTTYGYDVASRLTSLSDDLAGTTNDVTATFAYNPANQIVTETRDNALYAFNAYATASNSYTANGLNQYTAVGAGTLGYDSNGNLMSNGGTTFAYDVENRLVSASGTLSAALVYDPLGRLFSTAGRQYLYDGDELIGEFNGTGPLVKRYVHGNGEDDPLLWYAGAGLGTRYSLQADHQGSIVSIADATGAILAMPNSYDEYGVPGSGNAGTFQYTGQMYLPQLGMYYYKARIYSSRLGRFLQTDPIGYKDQVNLYAYVGNDPIDGRDPTGTQDMSAYYRGWEQVAADHGKTLPEFAEEMDRKSGAFEIGATIIPAERVLGLARVAAPIIRLMRGAEHFKPVAAGARALLQRAAAVQSGLRRLAVGEGRIFAGPGAKDAFRGAEAAAKKFGGSPSDYAKISVSEVTSAGDRVSIHAIRNEDTGEIFERKVIYGR